MPNPADNENVSTARQGADVNAAAPTGLTSDEARRRLAKFGPNAMPDTSVHPLRQAFEKFWTPVPWMLEAAIVLELALGKYAEASVIAILLVFNAALGIFPGKSRAGDSRRAEVAAGDERIRPPRWRVDECARRRTRAGRCREAVARRRGSRGCAHRRRRDPARSIHADRRVRSRSRPARAVRPMRERWCGAARRWRKSRRRARAPNSAKPPSSFSPLMSSARSRRRSCASCAIWPRSMASSSSGSRSTPLSQHADRRNRPPHSHRGSGLDSGRVAGDLHPRGGARRAQPRQARRPSDTALGGG